MKIDRKGIAPDPFIAAGEVHVDQRFQSSMVLAGNGPVSEGRVIVASGQIEYERMHQGIGKQVCHEPHEKGQQRLLFVTGALQSVAEQSPDQFVGVIDGTVEFSGKITESFLAIGLQIIIGRIVNDGSDVKDIAVSLQGPLKASVSESS